MNSLLSLNFNGITPEGPIVVYAWKSPLQVLLMLASAPFKINTFLLTLSLEEAGVEVCRPKHLINCTAKVSPSKSEVSSMLEIDMCNQSEG